jgi:hypothetical protein
MKCQVGPKENAGYLHVIGTACQSQLLLFYSTIPPPKLNHNTLEFPVPILLFHVSASIPIGRRMTQTTLYLLTHLPLHHITTMYPKILVKLNQTREEHRNQHSQTPQSTFCFIGKIQAAAQSPMLRWIVLLISCITPIFLSMTFQRISVQLVKIANEINRRRSRLTSRASRRHP